MSLTRKNLSYHLLKLNPEIKKIIRSKKRRRFYFGAYDENDIVQEVMLELWTRVPKGYDKTRGDIRTYCLIIANSFISRLGWKQNKYRRNIGVDFTEDFDLSNNSFDKRLLKIVKIDCKREQILFKVNIEDLARKYKEFEVVKKVYECDGDRKLACKKLGYSNAYITKQCNNLKRKGVLNKNNLVNAFYKRCII